MDKLKFDFVLKATEDGKSSKIILTSIGTQDDRNFIIPEEYQDIDLHTILRKTQAYNRVKNTLKKRHKKRRVWITLTEDLKKIYLDEENNLIFGEYYLEEVEKGKLEENRAIECDEGYMTKLLGKLVKQPAQ